MPLVSLQKHPCFCLGPCGKPTPSAIVALAPSQTEAAIKLIVCDCVSSDQKQASVQKSIAAALLTTSKSNIRSHKGFEAQDLVCSSN